MTKTTMTPRAAKAAPAPAAKRGKQANARISRAKTEVSTIKPKGKLATLVELLSRPEGATLDAMTQATGWQTHSVRGAMSGSLKKAMGLTITSEKTEAGRVYRITEGVPA